MFKLINATEVTKIANQKEISELYAFIENQIKQLASEGEFAMLIPEYDRIASYNELVLDEVLKAFKQKGFSTSKTNIKWIQDLIPANTPDIAGSAWSAWDLNKLASQQNDKVVEEIDRRIREKLQNSIDKDICIKDLHLSSTVHQEIRNAGFRLSDNKEYLQFKF